MGSNCKAADSTDGVRESVASAGYSCTLAVEPPHHDASRRNGGAAEQNRGGHVAITLGEFFGRDGRARLVDAASAVGEEAREIFGCDAVIDAQALERDQLLQELGQDLVY